MTKPNSLIDKLRRSWLFAWIAALVLGLAHLKDAAEGYEKMMVLLGFKPDSLALAASTEKGAFAREFSEIAWRRLFWARAVIGRVEHNWKAEEIASAYNSYSAASEAWHTKLMIFFTYTERFHGLTKAKELEQKVVAAMDTMAEEVSLVRAPKEKTPEEFKRAHDSIDAANSALFHFVWGFGEKERGG
jgi:hypothetical protein